MEEQMSKAEELSKKKIDSTKRTFKYVHLACFILVFAVDKNTMTGPVSAVWALAWIASGLAYIMFLGSLASAANKSVIQWVGGTIIFNYIGMFVSYYKMKTVAIEQGWDK